ncbi:hypothetical protein CAOG_010137 [Capsaspora owczarzaki ATCC 30864]|uniref:Uncharacterized protein n=1 Tax=Capsaspora owczarzaki (strain ATCC 30864) TaxID=595528 RepID=A0A0D2X5C0_CAPO3|nr:hypothetical protein CAOG_010137 [Capsaspora owczarzaki ATCC 30864]
MFLPNRRSRICSAAASSPTSTVGLDSQLSESRIWLWKNGCVGSRFQTLLRDTVAARDPNRAPLRAHDWYCFSHSRRKSNCCASCSEKSRCLKVSRLVDSCGVGSAAAALQVRHMECRSTVWVSVSVGMDAACASCASRASRASSDGGCNRHVSMAAVEGAGFLSGKPLHCCCMRNRMAKRRAACKC